MRVISFTPALFAIHAIAAPAHSITASARYQPAPIPNSTVSAGFEDLDLPPPSSCLAKLEGLLEDLTTSTLSVLLGSATTMIGYVVCGLTVPAESWETCTDYAVIGGSVVGISHLAIWKFPEILNELDMYQSSTRPWEQPSTWSEDEGPNGKVEVKSRKEED